jgi:YesN/AraC family two-component response regulator
MIKSTTAGRNGCAKSDIAICLKAKKSGKPETHFCHAGLLDTAVPIKYKERTMGFVIFGQAVDNDEEANRKKIENICDQLKLDFDELSFAHSQLRRFEKNKIDSASNILENIAAHLWLSKYIDIVYNPLASNLDDYIRENIKEELTVNEICRVFGISKNRLYEISHKWFKKSIFKYITQVRIDEAKKMLSSTDYPINQISAQVGINDYNYFTKVFKNNVGITPLKYRKTFPYSIDSLNKQTQKPDI